MRSCISVVCCSLILFTALITAPCRAAGNPSVKAIALTFAATSAWAARHPQQVPSGGGDYTFSAGAFDRVDRVAQTWNVGFERRWGGFAVWRLKPFLGAAATGRRSMYYYGGLRLNLHLTSH